MSIREKAKEAEPLSSDEEMRKLAVELRLLESTAESLQSRINFLNAAWAELSLSKNTLEGLEKEKANTLLFVPIGGGSYVKAKLGAVDNVVYGVGAGVAIEKTLKEAKQGVENRLSDLEKARMSMEQQLSQVLNRIQEDQDRFQELSADLRKRERS
jgi:prefoldin alpha subunit